MFQCLTTLYPHIASEQLGVKDLPEFQAVYMDQTTKVVPAEDDSKEMHINKSEFPRDPPYEDPFDTQKPIPSELNIEEVPDDHPPGALDVLCQRLRDHDRDHLEPTIHLRSICCQQDGSVKMMEEAQLHVKKYLNKHPDSPKVAVYALRCLRVAYDKLLEDERMDYVTDGNFVLILQLMNMEPRSCAVQVAGLEAFFHLMGAYEFDESLPLPPTVERGEVVSRMFRRVVKTTIVSLATGAGGPGRVDLKVLFDSIKCIIRWFHVTLIPRLQRWVWFQ